MVVWTLLLLPGSGFSVSVPRLCCLWGNAHNMSKTGPLRRMAMSKTGPSQDDEGVRTFSAALQSPTGNTASARIGHSCAFRAPKLTPTGTRENPEREGRA
jgi:hypothetical protein